jgi:sensor histidine kinase regulating citrate/malate metabolism
MKKISIVFIIFILLSCNKKENELKKQYKEVVKINAHQFIAVDDRGNIRLISANDDNIILFYQDVELCLKRDYINDVVNKKVRQK